MAKYRKTLNLSEMSMSATLGADKKGTSYTVKKIGKKLQKHGGLKVGEKLSDTNADDLKDSGIKVKFKPYKEQNDPFAKEITFNELEVKDWELDQHDGNLQELSPSTISSYQKKAGAQYRDLKKNTMSDASREAGYHKGYISDKEYDQQAGMADKKAKRGKGLAMSKGKGMKKEEMMPGEGKATVKNKKLRMQRTMDKHGVMQQKPPIKGKVGEFKKIGEAIQRRMDRKTIIATDPATGRKVVKIAPKREIDIGKGKMEAFVAEISDKMKMNYIKKAAKQVTGTEKMRDYQNQQMDKKPGSFSKSDKDFVNKKYDQDTLKRRKGMKMAASKLGEDMKPMKKPDYSKKEIRMGKGVAFDKRYKQGNYSGAYKTINKIKKGLADHPKVADALKRANEQFIQGE